MAAVPVVPSAETDRPLLVALHGWLLSGKLWQPLGRRLEPRWQLWMPDLPGFGEHPRPRGLQASLAGYGRWLAQTLQREAPQRPVVLIGHSLGGSVALHAAPQLGSQLRGLIQIGAGGGVYQPRPFRLVRRSGALFLDLRPRWLARWPGLDAIRAPLLAETHAARGLLACSTRRAAVRQLPGLAAQLAVPSLWIAGSRDAVMPPAYVRHLAGYCRNQQLAELQGAGHLPMRQMPGPLAELIEVWLREELQLSDATATPQSAASPLSCSSANRA
ncbi:MAG: alpha/beta fold hydrolase [Cyanobium sp.]|jgi:2-succinyl-6-hydroxy-2,4-cyclohexadiene-1-carboxylate synthase|nr:alpha/beta hydrolase [Synechococcaceae cyanobacterium]